MTATDISNRTLGFIRNLLLLFFIANVFSCKKKTEKEIATENYSQLQKYHDYITDITQGTVSAYGQVFVVLKNPVAGWSDNQELPSGLLKVSPRVKGKVIASSNRVISFQPDDAFDSNTAYTFTLDLGALVDTLPKDLEDEFVFSVKTPELLFSLQTSALQSYSKEWQYIEGDIIASDQITREVAERLVTAIQKEKALKIRFDKLPAQSRQLHFRIDSIQRFEEDSEVALTWSGKEIGADSEGKDKILIPGRDHFTVLSAAVAKTEDQYIEINFSDPLEKGQNLQGLVTLENNSSPKFTIDQNVLKVYPKEDIKGSILLTVYQGIQSTYGYKLKNTYTETISFQQPKPEIKLLQSGTILPTSDNLKFNFEAINLRAVDVEVVKIYENNILQFLQTNALNGTYNIKQVGRPVAKKRIELQQNTSSAPKWNAYSIDLKTLITPDPGALYQVQLSYNRSYSTYACEGYVQEELPEETTNVNYDEAMETSYWDGAENYNEYYDYDWNQRDNPCDHSYYRNKQIAANILATNLGVTVKKGTKHEYIVAVSDIVSTKPIPGATVTFYDYQQQKLGETKTDDDGLAVRKIKRPAYFAVVTSGKQYTYVKLNDGNALSISKFDVAGVKLKKGIKGYLYGERGVWRPGDTLFLSFMLNDVANPLPKNHPVKFELRDPYGKVVYEKTATGGETNFYTFPVTTSPEAPTGNWQARVKVGGASFSKALKIETIKPNRLKIKMEVEDEILRTSKPMSGNVSVKWLHGAIAKNLAVDINARFSPKKTTFKTFPNYIFDDPARTFGTEEQLVYQGRVDDKGEATFFVKPSIENQAAGLLKASFITKVYENGGDFSTDVSTKTVSPYPTYVGLNAPKGDKARGMLLTDTKHTFEVATVDENGKPKAVQGLKAYVYKVNWRWWWDTSEDNLSSYNQGSSNNKIFETTVQTNASGKGIFAFELKYPEWGRYLVRVVDPKGGHATGKTVYMDWPGWAGKSRKNDPSAATMLVFSTDKETYNVGEKAVVTFPSAAGGRALVTVENGSEVLNTMWVETKDQQTRFEIEIQEEYTPNVYVHISLIQPHAQTKNDLPIRLYGVVPIAVENPDTHLQPELRMPEVLRPEETVMVQVSERNQKAMTYSLAIVDEGLLDLTRFSTPTPWQTFYAREALGVKTWDIYDDVIGAYGGSISQIFSIGGDAEAAGSKSKKANRFKPMVIYQGPFELKAGETRNHTIRVPKYIGSVRTMVVAMNAGQEAFGHTEKTTPVRKPLMVLSSLPRKITLGEKVTVPVTVFAMENKVKSVDVRLKPNKGFKVLGNTSQQLSFRQPDEKTAFFEIEVLENAARTVIEVQASGNGERASYSIPIDIVNPNPVTTESRTIVVEPNSMQEFDTEAFGIKGSNYVTLEFSSLPPMNSSERLAYLVRYPHGCVEQTTSGAFPQLYLGSVIELSTKQKNEIQRNVEGAINRLKQFIQPNGGLSYWPGQPSADDWGTSYAGHFLLEANRKGYVLPIGFKSSWIQYQQQQAKRWQKGSNELAQAYRLYTLALADSPDLASMNRFKEIVHTNEAKLRLAAAYALAGQFSAAKQLAQTASLTFPDAQHSHYTYGSATRNRAMALETMIGVDDKRKAQELAETIAKDLSSSKWMSTQTTAYALLAMSKYAAFVGGKGIDIQYTINKQQNKIRSGKAIAKSARSSFGGTLPVQVRNNGSNTIFATIVQEGILPVGKERVFQRKLKAIIDYKDREGKILNPAALSQGMDFVAEVTITNTSNTTVKNLALTEVFPSGWEVVNTRFTDFGSYKANEVTYTDIRDDRVNFYFDLKAGESKTVVLLLNASYLGNYYLPGIQCEAMYDNDYAVRTKGRWVVVKK